MSSMASNEAAPAVNTKDLATPEKLGWTRNRHTSRRHADHRCGKAVTRRPMMVCKASQIGTWQLNLHPITRETSA